MKVTDKEIMEAFNRQHRKEEGKIELSASEVSEILNSKILKEGKTITRQAVDKRLSDLVGNGLVGIKHGRSHLYAREVDFENVFTDEENACEKRRYSEKEIRKIAREIANEQITERVKREAQR